jgi:hypothetical protein
MTPSVSLDRKETHESPITPPGESALETSADIAPRRKGRWVIALKVQNSHTKFLT